MKCALFCRIYQAVLYVAECFLPWRQPQLISGVGSYANLSERLKADGVKKVCIVTDKGIVKTGMTDALTERLKHADVEFVLFDEVVPNPTVHNVLQGEELYKSSACDAIVAVGGGSAMDCAKGIGARIARPNKTLQQMGGILKVGKKLPKLYAVPTTSGTGSETTLAAVLTDEKTHLKYAVNDPVLIPYVAVLDPLLMVGLPPYVTSTTGMDALCHAVEAYIGRANTKHTKLQAQQAVALIKDNLYKAYADGSDVVARENMQKASYLAGLAFTRAYVGYVHAIAHSLGGKYGIAHGLANAVVMPYVLEAYGKKAHKKLAELAMVANVADETDDIATKAQKFIEWIRELNRSMNIPDGFEQLKECDVDELTRNAAKEGNPLYPVPKIMSAKELKKIYLKLIKK